MKRIVSVCLAVCMLISVMPFSYAADDQGLEKAILAVKAVVDIPAEYTVFEYSTNEYQGEMFWNLNWSDTGYKNTINAQVDGEYTVLAFNKYTRSGQDGKLSDISKTEGEAFARAFLAKALPEIADAFRVVEEDYVVNYYSNTEFIYSFRHYVNDIPVINSKVMIGVNKYTGEVTFYNGYKLYKGEYKAPENVISKDAAKAKYIENIGIELMYQSYFDYQTKKIKILPVYSPNTNKNEAINAFTGEKESLVIDNIRDGYGARAEMALYDTKSANTGAGLTPEEEKAVHDMANYITKEKAADIIKAYFPQDGGSYEIESAYLYKDYYESSKYTWDISFKINETEEKKEASSDPAKSISYYRGAYGRVNAVTGEVISFYCVNYDETANKNISEETAKKESYSFIEKIAPEKVKDVKLQEDSGYYYPIVPVVDAAQEEKPVLYTYNYVRYANGIPFASNSISVTYDTRIGQVVSYNLNWYDNVAFPSIDKVIDKNTIFDSIANAAGFGLVYRDKSADEKRLVYDFVNKGYMIFDAFTGKQLGYDGKPITNQKAPVYTDIQGHWSESVINKLLENGIYISGDNEFKPDETITQYNFLRYLMSYDYKTDNQDDFYEMLKYRGIINDEEKAPDSKVSRQDAVLYVVRMLGFEKIAKHYEIYNYPFKDEVPDQYKGYITIAYALGIIKGDDTGNFNPGINITNAEAASIVFNVMTAK